MEPAPPPPAPPVPVPVPAAALDFADEATLEAMLRALLQGGGDVPGLGLGEEEEDEFAVAEGTTSLVNRQGTDRFYSKMEEQAEVSAQRLKRWLDTKEAWETDTAPPPPPAAPEAGPATATAATATATPAECRDQRETFLERVQQSGAPPPRKARTPRSLLLQALQQPPAAAPTASTAAADHASSTATETPTQPAPPPEGQGEEEDRRTPAPSPLVSIVWGEQLRRLLLRVLAEVPAGEEQRAMALLGTLYANLPRGDRYHRVACDKLGPLAASPAALDALRCLGFREAAA
eukprot:EG_transcript_22122